MSSSKGWLIVLTIFVVAGIFCFLDWGEKERRIIVLNKDEKVMLEKINNLKGGEFLKFGNGTKQYVPRAVNKNNGLIFVQRTPRLDDENSPKWKPRELAKRAKDVIPYSDPRWTVAARHFLKRKNIKKNKRPGGA